MPILAAPTQTVAIKIISGAAVIAINMKNTIVFIAACTMVAAATAQTYVKPHTRKDGTYVEGHVRSAPNNTNLDNYGTKGNYNPYTGKAGTAEPNYAPPPMPSYRQPTCRTLANGQYVCN